MSVQRNIYEDSQATAEACAQHILAILRSARATRDYATMALSGGSTPKLLFERLVAANFNWEGVHLFWVDERPVPTDDVRSNYKLAADSLIGPAGIPRQHVHRIHAELNPTAAADMYVEEMRSFFKLQPRSMNSTASQSSNSG